MQSVIPIISVLGIIFIIALGILILGRSRYYRRVFNDRHYKEIYDWLVEVMNKGYVANSSFDTGTAVVTSGKIALAYTRQFIDGRDVIHFSVSQSPNQTTGAVGGRFLSLILMVLNQNKCEASLFRTQSTVHHIELRREGELNDKWIINDWAAVISKFKTYRPIPVQFLDTRKNA